MASNFYPPLAQAADSQLAMLSEGLSDLHLSDKRVILSNPGTKFDDIYYSRLNTVQALSEVTYNTGRYTQSLSNFNFGSTSTVLIPNGSLLSTFYLHLEITPSATDANVVLPRGWGLAALSNIKYTMGSSNVSSLTTERHSIFQILMAQCEDVEKRSEMLRLAGEETFGLVAGSPISADLLIPLPWSSAVGKDQKLPFPTDLLSNPITVQISFENSGSFMGGSGVKPVAFSSALALMRQGDMLNKDAGLRPIMYRNPSLIYGYPFIHFESRRYGVTGQAAGQTVTVDLQGFINADLLGLTIGMVKDSDLASTGNYSPNPFAYREPTNVEILFNGQPMYFTPGKMHRLANMNSIDSASFVENSIVNPGAVAPFSSVPANTYPIYIDFSRLRCEQFSGHYDNVWRVPSNTITLRYVQPADILAGERYQTLLTYVYSSVANVRQGEVSVYFD